MPGPLMSTPPCAGFVTALDIGSKYIRADEQYQYVLVIGGYAMSRYLNL